MEVVNTISEIRSNTLGGPAIIISLSKRIKSQTLKFEILLLVLISIQSMKESLVKTAEPVLLGPEMHCPARQQQLAAVRSTGGIPRRSCRRSRDVTTQMLREKRNATTQLINKYKKNLKKFAEKKLGGIEKLEPNPKLEYGKDIKDVSDKVANEREIKIQKLNSLREKCKEIMNDIDQDTTKSFKTWIEDEKTKIDETIKNKAKNNGEKMKNDEERKQKKVENLQVLKLMFDNYPSLAILFEELLIENNWKIPKDVKKENFSQYFETITQQFEKIMRKEKLDLNNYVLKTRLEKTKEQEKEYEEWKKTNMGELCNGKVCSKKSIEARSEINKDFSMCPNCHYSELYEKHMQDHCSKWEGDNVSNSEKQNDLISLLHMYNDDMRRYIVEQDKELRGALFKLECQKAMLHDSLKTIEKNQFEIDEDWKLLRARRQEDAETISNLKSKLLVFESHAAVAKPPSHVTPSPPAPPSVAPPAAVEVTATADSLTPAKAATATALPASPAKLSQPATASAAAPEIPQHETHDTIVMFNNKNYRLMGTADFDNNKQIKQLMVEGKRIEQYIPCTKEKVNIYIFKCPKCENLQKNTQFHKHLGEKHKIGLGPMMQCNECKKYKTQSGRFLKQSHLLNKHKISADGNGVDSYFSVVE